MGTWPHTLACGSPLRIVVALKLLVCRVELLVVVFCYASGVVRADVSDVSWTSYILNLCKSNQVHRSCSSSVLWTTRHGRCELFCNRVYTGGGSASVYVIL